MFVMTYDDDVKPHHLVALDDIIFMDCDSQNPPELNLNCDFESDFCSWTQNINEDQADWERTNEGVWFENTGPGYDHTTSTGYYIYFSSHNHQSGDTAVLSTPVIPATKDPMSCLVFWYHIYGEDFDTIRVNLNRNTEKLNLWMISSTQGNIWKEALVGIPSGSENFWVVFLCLKLLT